MSTPGPFAARAGEVSTAAIPARRHRRARTASMASAPGSSHPVWPETYSFSTREALATGIAGDGPSTSAPRERQSGASAERRHRALSTPMPIWRPVCLDGAAIRAGPARRQARTSSALSTAQGDSVMIPASQLPAHGTAGCAAVPCRVRALGHHADPRPPAPRARCHLPRRDPLPALVRAVPHARIDAAAHPESGAAGDHREIDGVSDAVFARLLETSRSKGELQAAYVDAFARARGRHRTVPLDRQDTAEHLRRRADPGGVSGRPAAPHRAQPAQRRGQHAVSGDRWRCRTCRARSTTGARRCRSPPRFGRLRRIASWTCATKTSSLMCRPPWAACCDFAELRAPGRAVSTGDAHPERNLWREALDPEARADRRCTMRRAGPGAWLRPGGCVAYARARPLTFQLREGLQCLTRDE
jgi:hypothetical protein